MASGSHPEAMKPTHRETDVPEERSVLDGPVVGYVATAIALVLMLLA